MLEVEPTGERGSVTIRNGRIVIDFEKFSSSLSWKPNEMEPWLLLNVHRKSFAAVVVIA